MGTARTVVVYTGCVLLAVGVFLAGYALLTYFQTPTTDLTVAVAQPQDPAAHAYYVGAVLALTPTPTIVPTPTDVPLPTDTPGPALPVCETLARQGGSGPCTWSAVVTPAPSPTLTACQTPLPGASCDLAPVPTSAPLPQGAP